MTTCYYYNAEGVVESITVDEQRPVVVSGNSIHTYPGDPVGAYLAQRESVYPAYRSAAVHHIPSFTLHDLRRPYGRILHLGPRNWTDGEYDSQTYAVPSATSVVPPGCVFASQDRAYPDPETIRHLHTLHSLLPNIHPARKLSCLTGPLITITEQATLAVFARAVPKKLLVLFLGHPTVNKFLCTLSRTDNETGRGTPTCQALRLPRGVASQVAIRILVAWMLRACQPHTMHDMRQISVPKNTFVANSLAQTMSLLGLHKDAYRIDMAIRRTHFVRPMFAAELETLWRCLGEESKYVYAAVDVVRKRLAAWESGGKKDGAWRKEMLAYLEEHPRLEARVRDPELNEKFRPTLGPEWMRRLSCDSQRSQASDATVSEVCGGAGSDQVIGLAETAGPTMAILRTRTPPDTTIDPTLEGSKDNVKQ